jgi:hypothetical protein
VLSKWHSFPTPFPSSPFPSFISVFRFTGALHVFILSLNALFRAVCCLHNRRKNRGLCPAGAEPVQGCGRGITSWVVDRHGGNHVRVEPEACGGTVGTGTGDVFWGDPALGGNGDYDVQDASRTGSPQGITVPAQVTIPASITTNPGQWTFLQTLTPDEGVDLGQSSWELGVKLPWGIPTAIDGETVLDTSFPLPVGALGSSNGVIFGPNFATLASADLPTGKTMYTFIDSPGDDLTKPRPTWTGSGFGQTTIDHETRNDQWANYVMFLPPGTSSQWVPLKIIPLGLEHGRRPAARYKLAMDGQRQP